jgi:LAS superfamily LD-carboxypeptidase LdcB
MDSVSKLPQMKLNQSLGGKRQLPSWLGLMILILVIGGVLVGGLVLISNRPQQAASGLDPEAAADTRPLEITVWQPIREVVNTSTEVTVVSNKQITLEQHSRTTLQEVGELDGIHYYIAKIINLPTDKTDITLKFNDAAGNHFEQKLEVTRKPFSFPIGFNQIVPWKDAAYVLEADALTIEVDKQHRLFEDYVPDELVDLNKTFGLYTLNEATLRRDAGAALKAMLDELAVQTGKYVTVASGYRSYEGQVTAYSGWVRQLGESGANGISAKPGHSEHQLGTSVDLVNDETGWKIVNDFGGTAAGQWLSANCSRFGFTQHVDAGDDTTGYKEESWHFRYIGVQPQ